MVDTIALLVHRILCHELLLRITLLLVMQINIYHQCISNVMYFQNGQFKVFDKNLALFMNVIRINEAICAVIL